MYHETCTVAYQRHREGEIAASLVCSRIPVYFELFLSGSVYGQHIFVQPALQDPHAQFCSQSAEDTKGNSVPTLHGMALTESFAALTAADILPAAAACVARLMALSHSAPALD